MRTALADQIIETERTRVIEGINPKDRHVLAAALEGDAALVVKEDVRLRAEIAASGVGVEALDGDAFAMRLWDASAADVDKVVRHLIAWRRRRPVTPPR